MKIKLDENLPLALAPLLAGVGHEVDTVPDEGLSGASDGAVWHKVQEEGRFFITQDLDFSDIRRFRPGSHAGLMLVRLADPGRQALIQHIHAVFVNNDTSGWLGAFIVLTERKLRIHPFTPQTGGNQPPSLQA